MTTRQQKIATKVEQFPGIAEADVAAALNTPDPSLPTKRSDVATNDAREILLSTGEWGAVILAAEDTAVPEQVRGACIVLRDAITQTTAIRISVPAIYSATVNLLNGLVSAEILTNDTRNALMSLADAAQSWAEIEGVGVVTVRDIGIARGSI